MSQPVLERVLEAALRIRPGEQRRVGLMALYSACAIGAVVVGRSVRDTLYLAHRDASELPWMYVFSSIGVAVVSYAYARVADRFRRDTLNSLCAVLGAFLTVGSYFMVGLDEKGRAETAWVYPVLYVFIEIMGSVVVIQFWTMCTDLFNPREAKRLFGMIGAGGTLANVIFGFAIKSYIHGGGHAEQLLYFCALLLLACAGIARLAGRQSPATQPLRITRPRRGIVLAREGLSVMASPHLVNVAAIASLSAIAVTIIDFQFKVAAKAQFVHNQDALAGFFGNFYGICGGIALAVQLWATGRVLERYGILASLLPLPVGLAVGSGTSMVHPGLMATTLSKGSDTIFRYTMNDASMQLLYLPVAAHIRGRAKAFIDGILKPASIALAGLALLAYKRSTQAGNPYPLTITGLVLIVAWVVLLVRARKEYVTTLLQTLERRHLDLESSSLARADEATLAALSHALESPSAATVLNALELCQNVQGKDFGGQAMTLCGHSDGAVRAAALRFIGEHRDRRALEAIRLRLTDPDPLVQGAAVQALCALEQDAALGEVRHFLESPSPEVRAAVVVGLVRHAGLDGILAAAEPLKLLLNAHSGSDRALAASVLGQLGVKSFYRPLIALLQDGDAQVRRQAVAAAAKLKSPELVPSLLLAMRHRDTSLEAASALTLYGPGIETQLEDALRSSPEPAVRRGAALVLGRLGTTESAAALVLALASPDAEVRARAAAALSRLLRRNPAMPVDATAVRAALVAELARARDATVAARSLGLPTPPPHARSNPKTAADLLGLALAEERDRAIERCLAIVAVLHPSAGLEAVVEGLRSDQVARRANAVEVLDNTVPDPWKREILTVLEEGRKGAAAVESEHLPRPDVLAVLVGRGSWVGACAAAVAGEEAQPIAAALRAALASPTPALRESAAVALALVAPAEAETALRPLAQDPVRSVRRTSSSLLKPIPAA